MNSKIALGLISGFFIILGFGIGFGGLLSMSVDNVLGGFLLGGIGLALFLWKTNIFQGRLN
jgi:hypothetical protein